MAEDEELSELETSGWEISVPEAEGAGIVRGGVFAVATASTSDETGRLDTKNSAGRPAGIDPERAPTRDRR